MLYIVHMHINQHRQDNKLCSRPSSGTVLAAQETLNICRQYYISNNNSELGGLVVRSKDWWALSSRVGSGFCQIRQPLNITSVPSNSTVIHPKYQKK